MAASGPNPRELIGLGAAVAGSVILGLSFGFLLDNFLGTSPAFLFAGLAVGVLAAVAVIALQLRQFLKADSQARAHPETVPSPQEPLLKETPR